MSIINIGESNVTIDYYWRTNYLKINIKRLIYSYTQIHSPNIYRNLSIMYQFANLYAGYQTKPVATMPNNNGLLTDINVLMAVFRPYRTLKEDNRKLLLY